MLNLALMLEDSAGRFADREAVVLGDTRLSYAAVNAAANQVANLLADSGVGRGDRVALSCANASLSAVCRPFTRNMALATPHTVPAVNITIQEGTWK